MRGGTEIGAVNAVGFSLGTTSTSVGVNVGKYLVNTATQIGVDKSAAAGTGYSYRITVYEGTWGQHTVVASGNSPSFAIVLPPPPDGPPSVTVTTPISMQTVALGSTVVVQFQAKNWDTTKSLRYMPELLRGGTALGAATGGAFTLTQSSTSVGVTAGKYLVNTSTTIGQEKTAAAGTGYSYRITVYQGTWGQHTVIAAGTSPTFSFAP
jgi:hypothetical protein